MPLSDQLNLGLPTHTAYLKSAGDQAFTDDGLALRVMRVRRFSILVHGYTGDNKFVDASLGIALLLVRSRAVATNKATKTKALHCYLRNTEL